MPRKLFWYEFHSWLRCAEQHRLRFIAKEPWVESDKDRARMDEGNEVDAVVNERLRNIEAFKPGNKRFAKLYHTRYKQADLFGAPWLVQETRCTLLGGGEVEMCCRADAFSPSLNLVRDTKLKSRRMGLAVDVAQLMWNCWVFGTNDGELDIVYPPGYERTEWGFERLSYHFTPERFDEMIGNVLCFIEQPSISETRNPHACEWCPYTELCWPNLLVR